MFDPLFDSLIRNVEFVSRLAKAGACWALGIAAVWRAYDVLNDMSGMYMLVLCILFAFSLAGIGFSIINEDQPATAEQP